MTLDPISKINLGEISKSDAELILFCLYHNPLTDSPYFKRRLMYLKETMLQGFEEKPHFAKDSYLAFDTSFEGLDKQHIEVITKFLYAMSHRRKVSILQNGHIGETMNLVPVGIQFKKSSASLILYSESILDDFRFELENIQGISISPEIFTDRPNVDRGGHWID